MLGSLKEFFLLQFVQEETDSKNNSKTEHLINLSTAALLIEISRSDSAIQEEELQLINRTIQTEFGITEDEAAELFHQADDKVEKSVSLYEFTRILNDHLSREQRTHIVELLWRVAFADSVLDKYEEYYVRKIADLLYVSQQDYIKTKHNALEKKIN